MMKHRQLELRPAPVADARVRPSSFGNADESFEHRIANVDWSAVAGALDDRGYAIMPELLRRSECDALVALYDERDRFRSNVVMERHAFGRGEYRYFAYPLPEPVTDLRTALYPRLAPIANDWHHRLRINERFPSTLAAFTNECHAAGQRKPTPLMLRYGPNDYCCLHQDLYGKLVFPFQVVFLLSQPGRDFDGGEFLLTDTDPREAGSAEVVALHQGDAVVFAVNHRPRLGPRGFYRASMRHGVSRLHRGARHTLGVIFHDG